MFFISWSNTKLYRYFTFNLSWAILWPQQNHDTTILNNLWTRIGHKKNLEVERWQPQDFNYCLAPMKKDDGQ